MKYIALLNHVFAFFWNGCIDNGEGRKTEPMYKFNNERNETISNDKKGNAYNAIVKEVIFLEQQW